MRLYERGPVADTKAPLTIKRFVSAGESDTDVVRRTVLDLTPPMLWTPGSCLVRERVRIQKLTADICHIDVDYVQYIDCLTAPPNCATLPTVQGPAAG